MKNPLAISLLLSCVTFPSLAQVSLIEAVQSAAANNPEFLAQMSNANATREVIAERRAQLRPQLNLTATAQWDKRNLLESNIEQGSSTRWGRDNSAAISIQQILWNPVFNNLVEEAEIESDIADIQLEASRLDLIEQVASSYMDVLRLAETTHLFQIEINAAAKALELVWTRFLDGTSREVDALQAEARILEMQSRLAGVQLDLQESIARLEQETGLSITALKSVIDDFDPAQLMPLKNVDWVQKARNSSPELLAANTQRALAEKKLATAKSAYYPTLDFNVAQRFSDADRQFDTQPEFDRRNETSAGINFSWKMYDGGGVQASVRKAKNAYNASNFQLSARRQLVLNQVALAEKRLNVEQKRLQGLQATKKSVASVLKERRASFEAGLIDLPTLLEAERNWVQISSQVKFIQYDMIMALIKLNRYTGTLDGAVMQDVEHYFRDAVTLTQL